MYETPADKAHHTLLVEQQVNTVRAAKRAWNNVSPDWIGETWAEMLPGVARNLAGAQREIASASLIAAAGSMEAQGSWAAPKGFLNADAFVGTAADGRSLEGLLASPAINARNAIGAGVGTALAMEAAGRQLSLLVVTTLADVARSAASVMTTLRPGTGYVRIVHGDACDRCLIMAGRFYRWNTGYLRHPRCNCSHVSAHGSATEAEARGMYEDPYEAFQSMSEVEQNATFGGARAQAIRDGADISQIVNSKRGMTPNGLFTTEGATRRGYAGKRLKPGQRRATPELIYKWADGDRTKALALLEEHGYILKGGQNPLGALRGQREGFGQFGRGGTRKAASQAVLNARATGIRDPRNRYTMTAAELRMYEAEQDWLLVLQGKNPWVSGGFGKTPDPYRLGLNNIGGPAATKLTPEIAAIVEKRYLTMLSTGGEKFVKESTSTIKTVTSKTGTGTGSGGGKPPRRPLSLTGDFPDPEDRAYWAKRQALLPVKFYGERLEPHEIVFTEKFLAAGHSMRWIPRGGIPTPDFYWLNRGAVHFDLKSPTRLKNATIRNSIRESVTGWKPPGLYKQDFVIDIGDSLLPAGLREQLSRYNVENPQKTIASLWVMSKGKLEQIKLR